MGESQTNLDNRLELMDFINSHLLHDMDLYGVDYTWTMIWEGPYSSQIRQNPYYE